MIKYWILELLWTSKDIARPWWYDISEYQWNIYRILISNDWIQELKDVFGDKKIAKCEVVRNHSSFSLEILEIISDKVPIQKILSHRIKNRREQAPENFKERLTKQWINSAIDLIYFSTRGLRPRTTEIHAIIGRTDLGDIWIQEKIDLCKGLWWDLYWEIKEDLKTKANITNAISLVEYGKTQFVSTFWLKIISAINGYPNRATTQDMIVFWSKLWLDLSQELKNKLKKEKIKCWLDIMRAHLSTLLKYKKYFWMLTQKSLNAINLQDRTNICSALWREVPKEIQEKIWSVNWKWWLFKKITKLWLGKNTIFVIDAYEKDLCAILGCNIREELTMELLYEFEKNLKVKSAKDYFQKVTTPMLNKQISRQRLWLILWHSLKEITYYDKVQLGEKMWWLESEIYKS